MHNKPKGKKNIYKLHWSVKWFFLKIWSFVYDLFCAITLLSINFITLCTNELKFSLHQSTKILGVEAMV